MATCPGTTEWRERLGLLIDAMDRSVEDLGPEPPAWWGRGQSMQLTMATVAEHVAVQEDIAMTAVAQPAAVEKVIASVAAEPAGDEPAIAGDGAGDDKPVEPCTKRRKTHVPLEVGVVLLSRPRQARLDHDAVLPLRKEGTPILLRARAHRQPRKWFSHKTPGTARHRVPRLQPSVLWRRRLGRTPERTPGDTWHRLPLLHSPVPIIHAIIWVLFQETQGRAREGVARSNDTDTPRTVPTEDRVDIERCWHHRSQPHHQHRRDVLQDVTFARTRVARRMDTRRNITVFLATRHLVPDVYAQLIFQGKTSAVEPTNPYPTLLTTSHSESHWTTTTTTLTAFLTWLDTTVMNPDGSSTPWICFMDVCTVHVSQEFLAFHRYAHIRLVYVPPNTTAVCQPLDRAYMRPFKAALGRYSARYIGQEIQHHPDDVASITHSIAGMRNLIMRWTHHALKEIATMRHNRAAWSDIVCTDAEGADVLALATACHIAGTLFKHHRGLPAPELRTDANADEVGDVPVHEDPPDVFLDLFEARDA